MVASRIESFEKTIVVLLADTGERYITSNLFAYAGAYRRETTVTCRSAAQTHTIDFRRYTAAPRGTVSDRAILFLFSVVVEIASLAAAGWLLVSGQAGSVDGLFLLLTCLLVALAFGLYLAFMIRRAMEPTPAPAAQPAKASAAAPASKPAPATQA